MPNPDSSGVPGRNIKARQVIVLLLSMFIFTLGFGIIVPIIGYFTKSMGASAFELGLLMASMSAMQFLFAPLWGKASDKIGRKPVMLVGLLGFALSFTITGFSTQLWMLFVAMIIGGMLSAGIFPAVLAYIADISSPGERGRLMGLAGAASGLGIIIGPAISSVLAGWGLTVPFFASAALALATSIAGFFLMPESLKRDRIKVSSGRTSTLAVLKTPLSLYFFLMLFISFAIACLDTTYVYFLSDRFGMSELASQMPMLGGSITLTGPNVMGLIFTSMGIIAVVSQLAVGTLIDRYGEEKTIIIGLIILFLGMGLFVVSSELVSLLLITSLIGVGSNMLNPAINTLVSKRSPDHRQGEMMGVLGSFNSIGRVLGPSVGGFAYVISMFLPYLGSAAIALASTVAMQFLARGKKPAVVEEENVTAGAR